jgi:8-amino-7-oxononanoate synthase
MDQKMRHDIFQALDAYIRSGSLRTIPEIDHGSSLYLEYKGKKLLNLSSNNYLGLANSETLKKVSIQATQVYGTSSSASRLISGNCKIYDQLEKILAEFKKQQKALTVGSGYAANLCIMGALAGRGAVIFSDRLNHASIIDAAVLSRARQVRYRHADTDHLSFLLGKFREHPSKILVTDTVFSMDGDTAPLEKLVQLCKKHHVLMVVDEAHATGIFGRGRGLACHLGLENEIDVHMGTFSKAMGSYGGYIASSRDIIDLIITRSRPFIYSTSLPPSVAGASLAALETIMCNPQTGSVLLEFAQKVRFFLKGLGFDTGQSSTQIIPVVMRENSLTIKAWRKLTDYGVFTGAIRPPTVPEGTARLRLSLRGDMGEKEMGIIKHCFTLLAREIELSSGLEAY